jgi:hypothetical protein
MLWPDSNQLFLNPICFIISQHRNNTVWQIFYILKYHMNISLLMIKYILMKWTILIDLHKNLVNLKLLKINSIFVLHYLQNNKYFCQHQGSTRSIVFKMEWFCIEWLHLFHVLFSFQENIYLVNQELIPLEGIQIFDNNNPKLW